MYRMQNRRDDHRHDADQFDEDIQRRAGRVIERVADRVTGDD